MSHVLVMTYTVRAEVRESLQHINGKESPGAVSRAVESLVRYMAEQPNIDPESIRFTVEEA